MNPVMCQRLFVEITIKQVLENTCNDKMPKLSAPQAENDAPLTQAIMNKQQAAQPLKTAVHLRQASRLPNRQALSKYKNPSVLQTAKPLQQMRKRFSSKVFKSNLQPYEYLKGRTYKMANKEDKTLRFPTPQ
ncbi:hypothetical protein MMJ09_05105 [Bacillus vallismortis]|nr:hypothetical protein [Bacillus vallismortis]